MALAPLIALLLAASSAQAAVTGILIDENGKAVSGATLRAYTVESSRAFRARVMAGVDRAPIGTAQSAENGAFRIDASAPLMDVVIEAPGKTTQTAEAVDGEDLAAIVLHAAPTEKFRLVGGGKPVQNATLVSGTFVVRTDATGSLQMAEGTSGTGRLNVIHPDYAISGSTPIDEETFALSPGTAVRGRVVAADGQPIAKATITIEGWPLAESAADGTFTIVHAPSGWRTLTASDATRAATVRNTNAKTYEIKLKPAGSIAGTAAPGARVTITPAADRQYVDYIIADARGSFASGPLPASRYILHASRRGYSSANAEAAVVEGARVTRDLPEKALPTIRVRVVGEDQQPIAGAFVSGVPMAAQNLAITDKNGQAVVRQITDFTQRAIYVMKPGFANATSGPLADGKNEATVVLPRGFPLQIHVIDKQRQNVARANVLTTPGSEGEPGPRLPAACEEPLVKNCRRTGEDGIVRLRATEGPHELRVQGPSIVAKSTQQVLTAKSSPLTIEVDRGVVVSGRVAFSDGTPVTTGTVTTRPFGAAARIDETGAFTLRNVLPGKMMLVAMSTDQQIQSTPTEVTAPAKNVTLTIPTPARIEGRVTDKETGQPVTDFQVAVGFRDGRGGPASRPAPFHADDGSFAIDNLAAGPIRLQVASAGYAPGSLSDLTTEEGRTLRGVQVQLERGGSVRGHVTAGGNPIAGVHVRFAQQQMYFAGPGMTDTTTDDKGEYVIDGIGAGERTIDFSKEGYLAKHKSVSVERGKESTLDAELDHGRALPGRVTDKAGRPVSSARVSATSTVGSGGFRPATTDADGNFTLDGLADGRYTITATKDGYVSARQNDVAIPAQTPLALTLDTGGTISGRVRGLSDIELTAADVVAFGPGSNARAKANPDGTFTIRGVPDGHIAVYATTRGGAVPRQSPQEVVEVENGSAPSVDIDFGEGISVSGRVTRSGIPVQSGTVSFSGAGTRRNAEIAPDGRYQVDGLAAGNYDVAIFSRGGVMYNAKYAVAGNATYDIAVQGGTVHGRVVDASDGAPISDATVWSTPSKETPFARQASTDSNGQFELDAVTDGPLEIHASTRQPYAPGVQTITVSNGTAPDVEFRLDRAQATAFRVVDAQSGATIDAYISVADGKKMVANGGPTRDEDGAIRLYLGSGQFKAYVNARGYVAQNVDFTSPGPEVRVTLSQAGRVMVIASKPTRVRLVAPGAPRPYNGMAGPVGTTIEGIAPGNYTIEVLADDGKTVVRSMPVAVNAGITTTVNVE